MFDGIDRSIYLIVTVKIADAVCVLRGYQEPKQVGLQLTLLT